MVLEHLGQFIDYTRQPSHTYNLEPAVTTPKHSLSLPLSQSSQYCGALHLILMMVLNFSVQNITRLEIIEGVGAGSFIFFYSNLPKKDIRELQINLVRSHKISKKKKSGGHYTEI